MTRRRLGRIDLLPEECRDLVEWAARELARRSRTQADILGEFNTQLKVIDSTIPPVSSSGFNRYAIRLATMTARMNEARNIARALAGQFNESASDDLTIIAAEAIKTLVYEMLTAAGTGGMAAGDAVRLAGALRSAVQAQQISTARRAALEKELKGRMLDAVERVGANAGIGPEVIQKISEQVYGVFKDGPSRD